MANRYWVGGTASWDAVTVSNWSATDGGASGASVPGVADNVFFTASSGAVTVTTTYNPDVLFIDFTGFTGTFVTGATTIACTKWTAVTGMTLTATVGSLITVTGNNTFTTGSKTYYNVNLSISTNCTISGANAVFNNLTSKNTAAYAIFTVPNMTVNGDLECTGNNISTQRISWGSQSYFTPSTITVNGTTTLTNVDFRGVTIAGTATWSGTSIGNAGNNSATITFTPPVTRYWVHGASASQDYIANDNWSATSGGATGASFPLPQDTAVFDANSFGAAGKTVTCVQSGVRFASIDWSLATNSPTFTPISPNYYGSVTLISAMTYTPSGANNFFGLGNATLTAAGKTFTSLVFQFAPSTTLAFGSDVLSSGSITWHIGGLNANNYNVTCTDFNSTGGSVRVLTMGSGTWELTGTGAVWNFNGAYAPNVTITPGTSTIKLTNNSASAKSVYGIGKTWGNFWNATQGAGIVTIQDSATWNDYKIDAGRTQQWVAGTTTTFSTWNASGTLGNLITLSSTTAAAFTLSHLVTSLANRFLSTDYLNLTYCTALPTKTFYAGANSTDSGNNTGWIFTLSPTEVIKTINGTPIASIKTINGIAASAIKSVSGFI